MRTYSTENAAKKIGIHLITLRRWLGKALIRPSIAIPMSGKTLWRWTDADVKRARRLVGSFKKGPKPKANYIGFGGSIPRELPKGIVLVHNHVKPQKVIGLNGFRAWTQPHDKTLALCRCDWAGVDLRGLKHYRIKAK